MIDLAASIFKVTRDPSGTPLVLLDWLQTGGVGFPDATQKIDREAFPTATWESIFPRGNASGQWLIRAVEEFTTAEAMAARALAVRAAVPWGLATFNIRVLDLSDPATASEATRTAALYTGSGAIEGVSFAHAEHPTHLIIDWRLVLGDLVLVP